MRISFEHWLRVAREWVDGRYLERRADFGWDSRLSSQVDHVFIEAGKAFRPALTFWTWSQVEGDFTRPPSSVRDIALALEFIHTYSLVHDDLPAMDNDDFRRGRPTLHRLHREADAVLAGDALLTAAFEILSSSDADTSVIAESVRILARAAGGAGMIGGQYDDIYASPDLELLHRKKTGALIAASVELGALVASHRRAPLEDYRRFGSDLGLIFQIVDDLIDDQAGTGKTAGKDARSGKVTFANNTLGAEQRIVDLERGLYAKASDLGFEPELVGALLEFLSQRKS